MCSHFDYHLHVKRSLGARNVMHCRHQNRIDLELLLAYFQFAQYDLRPLFRFDIHTWNEIHKFHVNYNNVDTSLELSEECQNRTIHVHKMNMENRHFHANKNIRMIHFTVLIIINKNSRYHILVYVFAMNLDIGQYCMWRVFNVMDTCMDEWNRMYLPKPSRLRIGNIANTIIIFFVSSIFFFSPRLSVNLKLENRVCIIYLLNKRYK